MDERIFINPPVTCNTLSVTYNKKSVFIAQENIQSHRRGVRYDYRDTMVTLL